MAKNTELNAIDNTTSSRAF